MKLRYAIFPAVLFLPISVSSALALDMEYYTYNGFGPIVSAFTKLALIFSDGTYHAFFFAVIVLGILFGSAAAYFSAKNGRPSPLAWVLPTLTGVIFYFALIVPTGTLNIYDPVKNQFQPVAGVPEGIILVVGYLNLIERGLTEIVATSGDPVGYQSQAGGIGFDMLLNVHSKGILLQDQYLHQSLRKYIEDCVFFELNRPATTLTINQLSNNPDFTPLFDLAANPAIFTVFYNDATPQGVTQTCTLANTNIKTAIAPTTQFENTTRSRCAEAGFDPGVPVEYTRCKTMFSDLVSWFEGAVFNITQIFRQKLIADEINNVVLSTSPDTAIKILGSRNTGTAMLSSGIMANEWIPIIRAVTTALAIGIIPIILIFIPTPIFLRALGLLVAFFIWLTSWGVTDAIAHQFAIDYAMTVFEEIRQYQLGVTAISSFGTGSLKTLAAFGAIRWSGLLLATVLTTIIMKIGGHALSYLASSQTSSPKSAGERVGEVAKPEGQAGQLEAVEKAPPVMENANKFDFAQRTTARRNTQAKSIGSGIGLGDQSVAFSTGQTEAGFSVGTSRGRQQFANDTANGNLQTAGQQAEHFERSSRFGRTQGETAFGQQMLGLNTASDIAAFNSTGKSITPGMANHASKQGFKGVVPGTHLTHAAFDPKTGQASSMSFSGPVTSENIGALRDIAEQTGHKNAAQHLKPGMVSNFTINPNTGQGTFHATDNTSVNSEGFGEFTINPDKGLTVETPQGSFQIATGKVQQVGGQLYINGSTPGGEKIQLEGSLKEGFSVPSEGSGIGSESGIFEFDMASNRPAGLGEFKTGLIRDSSGGITRVGLNPTRGETQKGMFGKQILDSEGLNDLAERIRSEKGPGHVANALKSLAAEGKSAQVTFSSTGENSDLATVSVQSGGTATSENFSLSKNGMETIFKAHIQRLTGSSDINESVSRKTVDHGVQIGSAMQMALNRDAKLASFVSEPGMAKSQPHTFSANVATTASALSNDLSQFLKSEGIDIGSMDGTLHGGFTIAGNGAGAKVGRSFRDNEVVDLFTGKFDQIIRKAHQEAGEQGLNQPQTAGHITEKIGNFIQETYDKARAAKPRDFGADSGVAKAESVIKNFKKNE